MSKDRIKKELVEFVERELREAEQYDTSKLEVLCSRNRAFGAVAFTFCLSSELFTELELWWNNDMLEKFNTLISEKDK